MGSIILVNAHLHLHVEALRPLHALHFAFICEKAIGEHIIAFLYLPFLSHFLFRLLSLFIVMDCQQHNTPSLPSIDVMLQDAPSLTRKHQNPPLSSALPYSKGITAYRGQHDAVCKPAVGHRRHVSDFVLSSRPKPEEHIPSLRTPTSRMSLTSSIQNQQHHHHHPDNPPQLGESLPLSQDTPATMMMQSKLRYAADNNAVCAAPILPPPPPGATCTKHQLTNNESQRMVRPPYYHHGRSRSDMTHVYSSSATPSSSSSSTVSDHKTINKYFCSYCRKGFSRPSSLRTHTYSHTGEKPFVCNVEGCHRRFNVHSNLRRHLRTHQSHSDPMNTGTNSSLAVFAVNAEYCTPAW